MFSQYNYKFRLSKSQITVFCQVHVCHVKLPFLYSGTDPGSFDPKHVCFSLGILKWQAHRAGKLWLNHSLCLGPN